MLGIGDYLWRTVPANPILLRVVNMAGKRRRDLFIRCGYLGLLVVVVLISLMGSGRTGDLTELAIASGNTFRSMSYVQLALVALLAPIFTAGAITQEQDSQTYDILLSTPMSNEQIVLGSLLSRLFFIVALLISGIPVFAITQVFGGVAVKSIALSFFIAASTAVVTGAIAMAIATFKVGTRRTIFSFYLFIVIYIVGGFFIDRIPALHPLLVDGQRSNVSYIAAYHPFLALQSIFNDPLHAPPAVGQLPETLQGWYLSSTLTHPHTFFPWFMTIISFVLVTPSVLLLRKMAQTNLSPVQWLLGKLHLRRADRNHRPRTVWTNPIAWREARTRGSAARATLMRYGFIAAGLITAVVLLAAYTSVQPTSTYITRASYDVSNDSLAITDNEQLLSYRLTPDTVITANGEPATRDVLKSHRQVRYFTGPNNTLTAVEVYDLNRRLPLDKLRAVLLGVLFIELAIILLIVINAAASTVTREKEDGTLDLLLATPITSRYYIWGKLRGLVSYVVPLIAVPVGSVLIFIVYDLWRAMMGRGIHESWIVLPEAAILLPLVLVLAVAFAAIWSMQSSLRMRKTVSAVMVSLASIVGLYFIFGMCGWGMMRSTSSELSIIFATFSPFTLIMLLVDQANFVPARLATPDNATFLRQLTIIGTLIGSAAMATAVWGTYRSMVKNFDMTIRRQSR